MYRELQEDLRARPRRWLVTGAAGFIGSHLCAALLKLNQQVTGLDNFATGHRRNLDAIAEESDGCGKFTFIEGDIRDLATCKRAVEGAELVLHEAALGSVPRSLQDPLLTNAANIDGFLNLLVAARDAGVERTVYAASSSTYGDHPALPKVESTIGRPLSPYAVTKYVNELYADVFATAYDMQLTGLRYFNVFGPRQDPNGAYAAVIPRWFGQLLAGQRCAINGDGETSRDFCFIDNVIQANLLAAGVDDAGAVNQVYNVAYGGRTTLNALHDEIRRLVAQHRPDVAKLAPDYRDFRPGDVRHSQADIGKAARLLGYAPAVDVRAGLAITATWFMEHAARTLETI